jgi:hypothetical protein
MEWGLPSPDMRFIHSYMVAVVSHDSNIVATGCWLLISSSLGKIYGLRAVV